MTISMEDANQARDVLDQAQALPFGEIDELEGELLPTAYALWMSAGGDAEDEAWYVAGEAVLATPGPQGLWGRVYPSSMLGVPLGD